jgi:hypothetical protein
MITYSCILCGEPLGDTSNPSDLNNKIWKHFYQSHKKDTDPIQIFRAHIKPE